MKATSSSASALAFHLSTWVGGRFSQLGNRTSLRFHWDVTSPSPCSQLFLLKHLKKWIMMQTQLESHHVTKNCIPSSWSNDHLSTQQILKKSWTKSQGKPIVAKSFNASTWILFSLLMSKSQHSTKTPDIPRLFGPSGTYRYTFDETPWSLSS